MILGRQIHASEMVCLGQTPSCWNHSIQYEDDYLSPWMAVEQAVFLAWELGIPRITPAFEKERKITKCADRRRISFDENINIQLFNEFCPSTHHIQHEALQQWSEKPWHLHIDKATIRQGKSDPHVLDLWCGKTDLADQVLCRDHRSWNASPQVCVESTFGLFPPLPSGLHTLGMQFSDYDGSTVDMYHQNKTFPDSLSRGPEVAPASLWSKNRMNHEHPNNSKHILPLYDLLFPDSSPQASQTYKKSDFSFDLGITPDELENFLLVDSLEDLRRERIWEEFETSLDPAVQHVLSTIPSWNGQELQSVDIFTDGSYQEQCQAWSCVAIGTSVNEPYFTYIGFLTGNTSGIFSDEEPSSFTAELNALSVAARISIAVNKRIPVHIHADSQTAKDVSFGNVIVHAHPYLGRAVRACFQLAQTDRAVTISHVYAHEGNPWNELADTIAKMCRLGRLEAFHFSPSQILSLAKLEWMWLFGENRHEAYPTFSDGNFTCDNYVAPTKFPWMPTAPSTGKNAFQDPWLVDVKIASYNACTLKVPGKRKVLQQQFRQSQVTLIGIQEGRSKSTAKYEQDGCIVYASAADSKGNYGCEIWIDLKQGIWDTTSMVVVESKPRFVMLVNKTKGHRFAFISGHAPSAHHDDAETWWKQLRQALGRLEPDTHVLACLDANARLFHPGTLVDGSFPFSSCPGAQEFRDILQQHGLAALPRTDPSRVALPSWFHNSNHDDLLASGACLDYVVTTQAWGMGHQTCCDLGNDFETLLKIRDHFPVVHQYRNLLLACQQTKSSTTTRLDVKAMQTPQGKQTCQTIAESIPMPPWQMSATDHMTCINQYLQSSLAQAFPMPKLRSRKAFLSQAALSLVQKCRSCRKHLRHFGKFERATMVTFFFRAWLAVTRAYPQCDYCWKQVSHVANLGTAVLLKNFQSMQAALTKRLKYDQAQCAEKAVTDAYAQGEHVLLRHLRVFSTVKKKQSHVLPALCKVDGTRAISAEEVFQTWENHFREVEHGDYMDIQHVTHGHYLHVQRCQRAWGENHIENDALLPHDVPSRVDFEAALLRSKLNKAPGISGIPSEFFKFSADVVSRKCYPLILKTYLKFDEPLQWQGSLLKAIPKQSVMATDPSQWRQIALLDALGKAVHRLVREKLISGFEHIANPLQFGARPGRPTALAAHTVQLHNALAIQKGTNAATVFLDAKQAFHRVIRDLLWANNWSDAEQEFLAARLRSEPSAAAELVSAIRNTAMLSSAHITSHLQIVLESLFLTTWSTMRPGADAIAVSKTGTRPGDPLADILWSFLFAGFLQDISQELHIHGIGISLPHTDPEQPWIQRNTEHWSCEVLTPTWADDCAICLTHECPWKLLEQVARTVSIAQAKLRHLGVELNLSPGKTEVCFSFRGAGAYTVRKHLQDNFLRLPIGQGYHVHVTTHYKHLGSMQSAQGELRPELTARFSAAKLALKPLLRPIFSNKDLSHATKIRIFTSLVRSRLLLHAAVWSFVKDADRAYFESQVFKLLKLMDRAIFAQKNFHITHDQLIWRLGILPPQDMLRIERLRHLQKLAKFAPPQLWALLHQEDWWLRQVLYDDLPWVVTDMPFYGHKAPLTQDDTHHILLVLRHDAKAWAHHLKTVVKRHALFCERQAEQVDWESKLHAVMSEHGLFVANDGSKHQPQPPGHCVCNQCGKVFASNLALGVHRAKEHRVHSIAFQYAVGTQCFACLKHFAHSYAL